MKEAPLFWSLVVATEMTPKVEVVFDNLAVYLTWQFTEESMRSSDLQVSPVWNNRPATQPHFQVEYAIQTSQPVLNPGLAGLIEPEPATWTSTKKIQKIVRKLLLYFKGVK